MESPTYDRQSIVELYRKWFLVSKKDPNAYFDHEQVDDLAILIKNRIDLGSLIDAGPVYRSEIPIPYIRFQKIHELMVEIFVIQNNISCINIPGCIVEGENRKISFNTLINAIIECIDARIKNGFDIFNRVYPMEIYTKTEPISSENLIKKLNGEGWSIQYHGPYHTVLLKKGSKVTYTIANNTEISSSLHYSYNRLRFLLGKNQYRRLYNQ